MKKESQASVHANEIKTQKSEWKTVGVKIRNEELPLLNRQLDRLSYVLVIIKQHSSY